MKPSPHRIRILAVDLRARISGFVVMDGPTRLLDWGLTRAPFAVNGKSIATGRRVTSLLDLYAPSAVVVTRVPRKSLRYRSGVGPVLQFIRREATLRSIPLSTIGQREMRKAFSRFHARSKHEIATVLASLYPELLWKLPPKRKSWQHEPYRITMFDAIALGYTYLERHDGKASPPG